MAIKKVTVTGFVNRDKQFEVTTPNFNVRVGVNENNPAQNGPSPLEYLLSGYAGCINAVGKVIAKEQGIVLEALEVEVSGEISLDKYQGIESQDRAGFKSLEVVVKPQSKASITELKNWITELESRCPIHDNLVHKTPIHLSVFKEYKVVEAIV